MLPRHQELYGAANSLPLSKVVVSTCFCNVRNQFVNQALSSDGGAKQLDKILDEQLVGGLDSLAESLWPAAA